MNLLYKLGMHRGAPCCFTKTPGQCSKSEGLGWMRWSELNKADQTFDRRTMRRPVGLWLWGHVLIGRLRVPCSSSSLSALKPKFQVWSTRGSCEVMLGGDPAALLHHTSRNYIISVAYHIISEVSNSFHKNKEPFQWFHDLEKWSSIAKSFYRCWFNLSDEILCRSFLGKH